MLCLPLLATAGVAGVVGTWRGDSACTVRPSACHDESVVYHITAGAKPGAATITANKIVDGQEAFMGTIECTWDGTKSTLSCPIPRGVFRYQVAGENMNGTLTLTDGTLFRHISVRRDGLVRVPAGPFPMGADDALIARELELCRRFSSRPEGCLPGKLAHERPLHTVKLDAYLIDRDEVTNAGYDFCVTAGACAPRDLAHCETLDFPGLGAGVPEGNPLRAADHPVVCVTQPQGEGYCRWRGGRLPTEAEWEKAARGTAVRLFPWGDAWDDRVTNWGDEKDGAYGLLDGHALTAPVGSFPRDASPYGARDMGGNVWEWTGDWYAADAYTSGTPVSGDLRVTRGGGFAANPVAFTTAHRAPQRPDRVVVNIGFRCVVTPR